MNINTTLELTIKCKDLIKKDHMLKPFVLIHENNVFLSRTEKIDDNLNPEFTEKIYISFNFSKKQEICLEVWNQVDDLPKDLKASVDTSKHDLITKVHFDLAD